MTETVYLWLDDVRERPNRGWSWYRNAEEMWETIKAWAARGYSMVISLDHDLGELEDGTPRCSGYDLLKWIENKIHREDDWRPDIVFNIHSANPVGIENMKRAIESINSFLDRQRYADGVDNDL